MAAALPALAGLSGLPGRARADQALAMAVMTQNQAQLQRTRVKQMSRGAVYMLIGIETSRHHDMIRAAHDAFVAVNAGLRSGNPSREILAQSDPRVIGALETVEQIWEQIRLPVEEIVASGTATDEAVRTITAHDTTLLFGANNVVEQMLLANADAGVSGPYAGAINVAGRQRTTAQQLAVKLGKISLGIDAEASRRVLGELILLYE